METRAVISVPWQRFVNGISNVKHCSHQHQCWFISLCSCTGHGHCWEELCFPYLSPSSTFLPHWEDIWSPTRPALSIPAPFPPSLPPSSLLLFQDAGIRLETGEIQVNRHWLPVRVRDLLRLMMYASWSPRSQGSFPEGFHSLELKYELPVSVHSCPCKCLLT